MFQIQCDQSHQDSPILAICLRSDCQSNSSYCRKCQQLHPNCKEYLKMLNELPEMITELETIQSYLQQCFKQLREKITQVEHQVDEYFLPMRNHKFRPSLYNLNKLGQLFKKHSLQDIQKLENQKQLISQILDQYRDELQLSSGSASQLNYTSQLKIKRKEQERYRPQNEDDYFTDNNNDFTDNELILLSEGQRVCRIGNHEEAIQYFDESLKVKSDYAPTWHAKGWTLLHHLNRFQEAVFCFDKALSIDLQSENSFHQKGIALYALHQFEAAISCFDQQNKIKPNYYCYFWKGRTLENMKQLVEAEKCYIQGLKLEPRYQELKDALANVQQEINKLK